MLPTSKNMYLRLLQFLTVSLGLMLIYQTFFAEKKVSQTNLPVNENAITSLTVNKEESIKNAVETLQSFSEARIEEEEILPIGRNLFQNNENIRKVSSQDVIPTIQRFNTESNLVQISETSPNRFYVQNKPATLLIKGTNFSQNSKIYANGNLLETNFISSSEIETTLPTQLLFVEGTISLEVKTQKLNQEINSNGLFVSVVRPPMPSFVFVGMFSDSGGQNARLLLRIGKEELTVSVGDLVKNRWKMANFSGEILTFEDRETGLSYRLRKGEKIVSEPVKEVAQSKVTINNEVTEKNETLNTDLFKRSNKPMTSKELWEKRAVMAREKKKL
ncbi:MAG: IPT/TIG domain-containing protein [Acidobacteria bacterium]|nr:IPT/TIG domain-containing protein [Acidobacteriota bacterium]